MIRSMTGYGEAELDVPGGRLRVEIRTVNHRFFSVNLRLARAVERYEVQIREWLRAHLPRGHVNCTLRLERSEGDVADGGPAFQLDEQRAREYLRVLEELRSRLGVPGQVDLALLSRFNDLIVTADTAAEELPEAQVRQVTDAAARAVTVMREAEGERLARDLQARLAAMEAILTAIEGRAPQRLEAEYQRIRRVVADLLGEVPLDEDRVAREVAFLAERWDISEELVRLHSHITLFRTALEGAAEEPVGKRLSFLVQEMNREANTIGSKANDAPIEHAVIGLKEEIERLREQVENVE